MSPHIEFYACHDCGEQYREEYMRAEADGGKVRHYCRDCDREADSVKRSDAMDAEIR